MPNPAGLGMPEQRYRLFRPTISVSQQAVKSTLITKDRATQFLQFLACKT